MTVPLAVPTSVSRARMRLVLTAGLFCAWIGWLAYLAITTTRPVVVSRAQLLASQLDVVAALMGNADRPDPTATVQQVIWPGDEATKQLTDQPIKVANLRELTKDDGWDGPGAYIVPLVKNGGEYRVAPIPPSPGLSESKARPRIYRATPQALEQLVKIRQIGE